MWKGEKETVLQLYTRFFEEKQSLMNETYFGEAGAESIVLGDLEIEECKRNGFTHNTFLWKTVLMYDAYFCGAGGAETDWTDLVVRGGKKQVSRTHGTFENRPVPT